LKIPPLYFSLKINPLSILHDDNSFFNVFIDFPIKKALFFQRRAFSFPLSSISAKRKGVSFDTPYVLLYDLAFSLCENVIWGTAAEPVQQPVLR